MHNYSRGWSTRKGDGAQTEAQTGESGTKRGDRSPHTLTAVTAPTDGLCLELLANVVVWARKRTGVQSHHSQPTAWLVGAQAVPQPPTTTSDVVEFEFEMECLMTQQDCGVEFSRRPVAGVFSVARLTLSSLCVCPRVCPVAGILQKAAGAAASAASDSAATAATAAGWEAGGKRGELRHVHPHSAQVPLKCPSALKRR